MKSSIRLLKHEGGENYIRFGLRHNHLTVEDIEILYRNTKSLNRKINIYKKFVSKYKNLRAFENNITPSQIKTNSGDEYPRWYILKLIEYGRILVSIEVLMSLRLKRDDFLVGNSYLIDIEEIKKFEYTAINHLGYSEIRTRKHMTIHLLRALLYMQLPIDRFSQISDKYIETIDKKREYAHKRHMEKAINVLKEMSYDVSYDFNKKPHIKVAKGILKNPHPQIIESIEAYAEYLKYQKNARGLSQELSNLRCFFDYLYMEYPKVDKLYKLSNEHIEGFIKQQKNNKNIRGTSNSNSTVNLRIQALRKMLSYLRENGMQNIPYIISKFDRLKEAKKILKYIPEKELYELINIIANYDAGDMYIQHKMVLVILMDTGRRIHEVLSLSYDCYKDGRVFFHKTKNNKPHRQIVGDRTINAIRILKEYSRNINKPLYSVNDGRKVRRLIPSKVTRGTNILSIDAVDKFFKKIQIENGFINSKGKPKYTLHSSKKNFTTCLQNAGIKPQEIAKFLNQTTNSLVPYEVNNSIAIEALKRVEAKRLLMGKSFYEKEKDNHNPILSLLSDIDIVQRYRQNFVMKINNPKETMPLFLGSCTDYNNYDACGDMVCIACDEFRTDAIENFRKYTIKMYKYIYKFKRDNVVRVIENRLLASLEKAYNNIVAIDKEPFKSQITKLKRIARKELSVDEKRNSND